MGESWPGRMLELTTQCSMTQNMYSLAIINVKYNIISFSTMMDNGVLFERKHLDFQPLGPRIGQAMRARDIMLDHCEAVCFMSLASRAPGADVCR